MAPTKNPKKPAKSAKTPGKPAAKPRTRASAKPALAKPTSAKTTTFTPKGPRLGREDVFEADPTLFDPLTAGEVADALRTLTEDRRVSSMAKVGRYRVIATEPLVVKPPSLTSGHRLARVVAYDHASDRCIDACVDLDAGKVSHLETNRSQPMLSRDEEALAVTIATNDDRVRAKLALGDVPQTTMHYWGRTASDLAF
ncbi:MAG: hypothetical protein NT062_35275 [Proteobacteria bacterium]|nr:hypothetical protein [Pseudomonadota bacterium]